MWPSFSLCAWRILKIRSCLRRPLAPGRSRDRAILVNSVIFFSLSSAMVINHLQGIYKGGCGWKTCNSQGRKAGLVLRSPPFPLGEIFRLVQNGLPPRAGDPVQYLIHGFLNAGARPVKLPGGLGGKLT